MVEEGVVRRRARVGVSAVMALGDGTSSRTSTLDDRDRPTTVEPEGPTILEMDCLNSNIVNSNSSGSTRLVNNNSIR